MFESIFFRSFCLALLRTVFKSVMYMWQCIGYNHTEEIEGIVGFFFLIVPACSPTFWKRFKFNSAYNQHFEACIYGFGCRNRIVIRILHTHECHSYINQWKSIRICVIASIFHRRSSWSFWLQSFLSRHLLQFWFY